MRFGGIAAVVLAVCLVNLGNSSPALAQEAPNWADKAGAVGIGGNTTLGGTNGVNIRTWVSSRFGIQGTIGFSFTGATAEPDGGGDSFDTSQTAFQLGLYATYKLAYWQRGHLSTIFGTDITTLSESVGDADDTTTDVVIGLGIQGEYFPTQYLSLFVQTGLRMDFLSDDSDTFGVDPGLDDVSGIDVALGADLWGTAGFTVWFK